jgi:hypothetical protein
MATQQLIDLLILYALPVASGAFLLYALVGVLPRRHHLRLARHKKFSPDHKNNYASKKFLTNEEKKFFKILSVALPNYHICPQVSFNALITHAAWISRARWAHLIRSKFNTKYVDFVLCHIPDFTVMSVVEYDGSGHKSHDDPKRDSMLRNAGYRVERFTSQDTVDSVKMRFNL